MVSVPLFRIPIMAVSMALGQYFGGSAVAAASMMVEALAPPVIVPRRIKRYVNSSPLPPCSTVLQAAATSEQQAADAVSPTPPSSLLRSVTFCNLPKDQGPPDLLCDLLMEIGACSTSITDADRGTDQEVPVVHEFSSETTPFRDSQN